MFSPLKLILQGVHYSALSGYKAWNGTDCVRTNQTYTSEFDLEFQPPVELPTSFTTFLRPPLALNFLRRNRHGPLAVYHLGLDEKMARECQPEALNAQFQRLNHEWLLTPVPHNV